MPLTIHELILRDRDTYPTVAWSEIENFRNYYKGKQDNVLTDKQKAILEHLFNFSFSDNVCAQIISEASGRARMQAVNCSNPDTNTFLQHLYKTCRAVTMQNKVHRNTLRDGNGVVLVSWSNKYQKVQTYIEEWWDGTSGVWISYDEEGTVEYAVKDWKTRELTYRRIIWFEDRVERYESTDNTTWIPYVYPGEPSAVMPWTDLGVPIGIPFIHFQNSNNTEGQYGISDLDGGVLGYQDQLTDTQWALSAAVRLTAFQSFWGTGIDIPNDPATGLPMEVTFGAGSFLHSKSPDAKFGVLPAGSVEGILSSYRAKLGRVAQMTRTPLHAITGGEWPSGEALLRAEMPAVNKAQTLIDHFTTTWVAVFVMCLKVHNRYTTGPKYLHDVAEAPIEVVFSDPAMPDRLSQASAVAQMKPSISILEALRLYGYSEIRAQAIYEELKEEKAQEGDSLLRAIDQGVA